MLQDDPALRIAAIGGGAVILFYLLAWLLVGRDPPQRHHHSAVRPAGRHVGRGGALRRGHDVRRPRVRRGDRRSRRQRPSQAVDRGGESGTAPHQERPAHRRGGAGGRKRAVCQGCHRSTLTNPNTRRSAARERRCIRRCRRTYIGTLFATISGGRASASSPSLLVVSAIVARLRRQLWLQRGRHHRRHVDPAIPDHDRRRHDARRGAARRP